MDNKVQMSEHSDTDCPHYLRTVIEKMTGSDICYTAKKGQKLR